MGSSCPSIKRFSGYFTLAATAVVLSEHYLDPGFKPGSPSAAASSVTKRLTRWFSLEVWYLLESNRSLRQFWNFRTHTRVHLNLKRLYNCIYLWIYDPYDGVLEFRINTVTQHIHLHQFFIWFNNKSPLSFFIRLPFDFSSIQSLSWSAELLTKQS